MKKLFPLLLFALFLNLFSSHAQPEEPVKWSFSVVKINDSIAELQLKASIQEKWHLYAMSHNNGIELPLEFSFTPNPNYTLEGKTKEPKPIEHFDSFFDDYSRYFVKSVTFKQKIKVKSAEPFEIRGEISGQACIEGRCVAIDRKMKFNVSGFENLLFVSDIDEKEASSLVENSDQITQEDELIDIVNDIAEEKEEKQSLWLFFLTAIGGGLIGLLMPCVFPMIPMTVSFFMKSKNPKFDASIYGLSIVIIFVIVGILLSLIFGPDFANIVSTHWLPNIIFALIFIVFAISLFGYFEIALPSKWVNKSAKMESRGGVLGIFFMALTLVLVSFSCTLPIAGAVALSSADGDFLKPVIGMLGFSLGIAVPFTFFAFFPNLLKKMPKSGGWMNTLKVSLAFVELAFALKFLNVPDQTYHWGILDREVYLAFWIVICSLWGLYLLGKIKFPHDDDMPYQKSWVRYFLSIGVFTFVVYLIPGMFGAPLKAISGWLPPMTTQDFDINHIVRSEMDMLGHSSSTDNTYFLTETPKYGDRLHLPYNIKGYFDYDQALSVAKKENKPLFIDFTGHGCVNCRKIEAAVWVDARIRKKFKEDFVVAALYVDDKVINLEKEDFILDEDGEAITKLGKKNMYIQNKKYNENSQPCYLVVDYYGNVLAGPIYFEMSVENYLKFLDAGLEAFRKRYP